jgi:hypothetical protein
VTSRTGALVPGACLVLHSPRPAMPVLVAEGCGEGSAAGLWLTGAALEVAAGGMLGLVGGWLLIAPVLLQAARPAASVRQINHLMASPIRGAVKGCHIVILCPVNRECLNHTA